MKNGKILVLTGKSSTGKSTVEKELENRGLKRAVTYTTRPQRDNEIDSEDYYFVTNEQFQELYSHDRLIEHRIYKDKWYYGLGIDEIDLSKGSWVVVTELEGLKAIRDYYGKENVISIYLYVDDRERLLRSLSRDKNGDVREIVRRFIADEMDFSEDRLRGNYILRINNVNITDTVNIILRNFKNEL